MKLSKLLKMCNQIFISFAVKFVSELCGESA